MEDVQEVGPDGPRWHPPRWVVRLLALAAVAAIAGVVMSRPDSKPATSAAPSAAPTVRATLPGPPQTCDAPRASTSPADWTDVAAMALADVETGGSLMRRGPAVARGPWSVLVHRADGSLGQHGAVVTYPVERLDGGKPVDVGGARGRQAATEVVWSVGGRYARVRGDLGADILTPIARVTTVSAGARR
jgi:hypothetical protein